MSSNLPLFTPPDFSTFPTSESMTFDHDSDSLPPREITKEEFYSVLDICEFGRKIRGDWSVVVRLDHVSCPCEGGHCGFATKSQFTSSDVQNMLTERGLLLPSKIYCKTILMFCLRQNRSEKRKSNHKNAEYSRKSCKHNRRFFSRKYVVVSKFFTFSVFLHFVFSEFIKQKITKISSKNF